MYWWWKDRTVSSTLRNACRDPKTTEQTINTRSTINEQAMKVCSDTKDKCTKSRFAPVLSEPVATSVQSPCFPPRLSKGNSKR